MFNRRLEYINKNTYNSTKLFETIDDNFIKSKYIKNSLPTIDGLNGFVNYGKTAKKNSNGSFKLYMNTRYNNNIDTVDWEKNITSTGGNRVVSDLVSRPINGKVYVYYDVRSKSNERNMKALMTDITSTKSGDGSYKEKSWDESGEIQYDYPFKYSIDENIVNNNINYSKNFIDFKQLQNTIPGKNLINLNPNDTVKLGFGNLNFNTKLKSNNSILEDPEKNNHYLFRGGVEFNNLINNSENQNIIIKPGEGLNIEKYEIKNEDGTIVSETSDNINVIKALEGTNQKKLLKSNMKQTILIGI